MNPEQALRDLALRLMPPGFGCAVLSLAQDPDPLLPAEEVAMARAVAKRRREFALGRMALRRALAEAGHERPASAPIAQRPDRRPDLPQAQRASLSHSGAHCIAIAAPPGGPWVGVDIEPLDRAPPEGLSEVVMPYRMANPDPLLVFCGKEAMFKAQYPASGRMLDFSAVPAVVRGDRIRACLGHRLIGGRWGVAAGYYLAISLWRG
ncbi:4'-phosphopantetheinyl transferase family protein [Paracoccus yeei]|uniref:4-phosphopantetheinyl transferase n=1 Tax=Paracoccus yeei TaxID=147645 RepID=A0A2D2BX39_9RHOB|nr:4-phosphopantetheinyl transferase [Paracoccus yeei]ATQ54832.1 4-phosphopantetheinyl transferase [Paracoccus yeei]